MTPDRCIELIYNFPGTIREKLECAQMGYHGNLPRFGVLRAVDGGAPVGNWVTEPFSLYDQLKGSNEVRRCQTCNCGGASGGGAALSATGGANGGIGGGSGFGASLYGPGGTSFSLAVPLLLVVVVAVAIVVKRK